MSPQLLREARPVARKAHRCSMCYGRIQPGETYDRDTLVYDGRVYDWLTCPGCSADSITNRVWEWSYAHDEGVGPEDAHEWATEQVIHGSADDQRASKRFLERWADS